jgi:hypothetical protein
MDITDALMTAAHFHDLDKPQRNSDGDTMREAATEIHKLRAEREALRQWQASALSWLRADDSPSALAMRRDANDPTYPSTNHQP